MVDGKFLERTHHRVVGTKGSEPPASRDGVRECADCVAASQHEFVCVGVRVATIDEAFAVCAGVELPVGDGKSLGVQGCRERGAVVPEPTPHHHHRLRNRQLRAGHPARCRRGARIQRDCLGHDVCHRGLHRVSAHRVVTDVLRLPRSHGNHEGDGQQRCSAGGCHAHNLSLLPLPPAFDQCSPAFLHAQK